MGILSCGCKKPGNGAATLAPNGSPPVAPIYSTQSGACGSNGAVAGNQPFLVSPEDYASVPPLASVPVISRLGRRAPNNTYVFSAPQAGTPQVQSPKVGRY